MARLLSYTTALERRVTSYRGVRKRRPTASQQDEDQRAFAAGSRSLPNLQILNNVLAQVPKVRAEMCAGGGCPWSAQPDASNPD
jgi:hypothetical protein